MCSSNCTHTHTVTEFVNIMTARSPSHNRPVAPTTTTTTTTAIATTIATTTTTTATNCI